MAAACLVALGRWGVAWGLLIMAPENSISPSNFGYERVAHTWLSQYKVCSKPRAF